jgi:hypothetical protein
MVPEMELSNRISDSRPKAPKSVGSGLKYCFYRDPS